MAHLRWLRGKSKKALEPVNNYEEGQASSSSAFVGSGPEGYHETVESAPLRSLSVREGNGGHDYAHQDWGSASHRSFAAPPEHVQNDAMIAQMLSEELSHTDVVRKRLTNLPSIPHRPKVNTAIPTQDDAAFDHQRLSERLDLYGLRETKMIGDGNCQFRALSHQLYFTPEFHKFIRKQVIKELKSQRDLYEGYVPMKYGGYLKKMSRCGEWGDHVTLQAAADHFGVKICLLTSFRDTCFIEIVPRQRKRKQDVYLSFWSDVHYNSVYAAAAAAAAGVSSQSETEKKKHWLF